MKYLTMFVLGCVRIKVTLISRLEVVLAQNDTYPSSIVVY